MPSDRLRILWRRDERLGFYRPTVNRWCCMSQSVGEDRQADEWCHRPRRREPEPGPLLLFFHRNICLGLSRCPSGAPFSSGRSPLPPPTAVPTGPDRCCPELSPWLAPSHWQHLHRETSRGRPSGGTNNVSPASPKVAADESVLRNELPLLPVACGRLVFQLGPRVQCTSRLSSHRKFDRTRAQFVQLARGALSRWGDGAVPTTGPR